MFQGAYAREIIDALPIETVFERYGLETNRSGFMRCPFHGGDRTPSLKIYSVKRSWHCFGCGRGGDIINFVRELFNLDFISACKQLDTDFALGVIPLRPDYRERKAATQRARELAEKQAADEAEHARLYLEYSKALYRYKRNKRLIENNPPGSEL